MSPSRANLSKHFSRLKVQAKHLRVEKQSSSYSHRVSQHQNTMAKRKAREDPDSSCDEDVAPAGPAKNRKASKRKSKKSGPKADGKDEGQGPFDDHARPSEAETRVHSHLHLWSSSLQKRAPYNGLSPAGSLKPSLRTFGSKHLLHLWYPCKGMWHHSYFEFPAGCKGWLGSIAWGANSS